MHSCGWTSAQKIAGICFHIFPNEVLQPRSANKDQQSFEGEFQHREESAFCLHITLFLETHGCCSINDFIILVPTIARSIEASCLCNRIKPGSKLYHPTLHQSPWISHLRFQGFAFAMQLPRRQLLQSNQLLSQVQRPNRQRNRQRNPSLRSVSVVMIQPPSLQRRSRMKY